MIAFVVLLGIIAFALLGLGISVVLFGGKK